VTTDGAKWRWQPLGGQGHLCVAATTVTGGKTYVFELSADNHVWMRTGA
jgi:hypothetical protein